MISSNTSIQKLVVESLPRYIEWTESVLDSSRTVLFRGQPVKGNLLPSIARNTPNYDSTQLERSMLDQFKLMGASLLTGVDKNPLELIVVAQHYGLKTRLLDWTSNPLAALFFACSDTKEGDAYVYALQADGILSKDAYDKDPFAATKTRVFQPPLNNPRIIAQQGWFTLHKYSDENRQFTPLELNGDTKDAIAEVVIPCTSRQALVKSLIRHGIATHTMFPDLAGLSQHLNAVHSVG